MWGPRTLLGAWVLSCLVASSGPVGAQGLAAKYPNDVGLGGDPAVLYFLDFDDKAATEAWHKNKTGYGWTSSPANVYAGGGALEIQQSTGTHHPYEIHPEIDPSDRVFVRWYRMWEPGYDFTQHKMPGVYAKAPGASGAGQKPDGTDKYSCKLFVDFDGYPRFYSYHPDQKGIYGDEPHMNLVDPKIKVEAGRWYCFEMMIKANNPPARDGELKMWIDGKLVGHIKDMRFRDVASLKINEFTYSAYVGGSWTSKRDQKLWDDQIVVARSYIGPLVAPTTPDAGVSDSGAPEDAGRDAVPSDAAADVGAADGATGGRNDYSDGCRVGASWDLRVAPLLLLLLVVVGIRRSRR